MSVIYVDLNASGANNGTSPADAFSTISAALGAAATGDTIKLAPGIYEGHFTIAVDGLTIESATGIASDVIIKGDFRDDNPSMGSTPLDEWIGPQASYNGGTNNNGFVVESDGVTIRNLTIIEQRNGIQLGSATDLEVNNLTIEGVVLDNNLHGIHKENGGVEVDGFTLTDSTISHGYQGIIVAAGVGTGEFTDVTIDHVTFQHLTEKGIYVEQLSDADLTFLTMNDVGQFGRGDAFGNIGESGVGIDINLKYGDYSDITISDFTFTDVGLSNGAGTSHFNGSAIAVKARDDGSYATPPATLDNVTIENGTIDGTSTGVRVGEPNKGNDGPTGVTVENVSVTDFMGGQYDNQSEAPLTVVLTGGEDSATANGNSTGPIVYQGLDGDDTMFGASGDETFAGGGGSDTMDGGTGTDTASYTGAIDADDLTYNAGDGSWTVDAGTEGADTLSNIEVIDSPGGRILLVGGTGYPTIQAAIDAALDGDTIIVAAGTYNESVTVDKDVTLLGANYDNAGSGSRVGESVITGGIHFAAGSEGATLNGFAITGTSDFGAGLDRPVGVLIGADDVTVTNNVLTGSPADTRPFDAFNGADNFVVSDNLVTGWTEGAYIVAGTSGTIEDNVFDGNGNGVVSESTGVEITGNTFSNSDGAHIAPLPFEDTNVGDYVHDNTFLDGDRPISIYLNGAADNVTGSDVAETIHGEYVAGPVTINGAGGDDYLIGSSSDDTLDGGAGEDTIDGGLGADTMDGGADDDTYLVDNSSDVVSEASGAGTDTVLSSVSYTIADDDVENLTLTDAGSGSEDFESGFDLGPITDGENGWNVDNAPRGEVVDLGGNNVMLISSDPGDGTFGGPYSHDIGVSAGEPQTTADGDVHIISFRVKAVDSTPDNSRMEVDFGNVAGTDRNNFMVIESIAGEGIRIAVADPLLNGDWDTGAGLNDFSAFTGNRTLISGVDANGWLDIELRLRYVDGPNNDVIDVYLNGEMIGQTTTFENYRDSLGDTHATNAENNQTSRILFRGSASTAVTDGPGGVNNGFYFDDLTSTVTSNTNGTGNASANVITGNSGDNILLGLGGNDTLNGGGGNDTLDGGEGTDTVNAGAGNDTIIVNAGDDDTVDGGDGFDTVNVIGSGADETVHAAYSGILTSVGGNVTNVEAISLDMGGGSDTLDYSGSTESIDVNLVLGTASGFTSIANVENVIGGSGSDSIIGDGGDNIIDGGAGEDFISAGNGADTITGGAGSDTIDAGGDTDTVVYAEDFGDLTITRIGATNNYIVTNLAGDTDTVLNVENFRIDGVTVSAASAVTNAGPTIDSVLDSDTSTTTLLVNETTAPGTTVAQVNASDPNIDAGLGDSLSYSLLTVGDAAYDGPFEIDASGAIKVKAGADLDFEGVNSFTFKVKVTDAHGNSTTEQVTIDLTDLNDNAPVFSSLTTANVNENVAPTTVVYDANATDADSNLFGNIVYSLGGTDAALLNIDAATGDVRLNASPNFETKASYSFDVTATQGSTQTTQTVTLSINDLNDNAPVFSSLTTANVNENMAASTIVYDANATDADSSVTFGNIAYSLTGADAALLNINAATGEVRLNSPANHEAKNQYLFNVVAAQGTTSSTRAVTLTIGDVNEPGVAPIQDVSREAGLTQSALGLTPITDPEGDTLTYQVTTLPSEGTLFLANGAAVTLNQILTQQQFSGLTYSSPETVGPNNLQFVASDGTNDTPLNIILNVTAALDASYTGTGAGDRLDGGAGNDTINGLGGADLMIGGTGNDTFHVDNGSDRVNDTSGTDSIISSVTYSLTDPVRVVGTIENLTLTGSAFLGIGNAADNVLLGNALGNQLRGMDGNDTINGLGGADFMQGGAGDDTFHVDNGSDRVHDTSGTDSIISSVTYSLGDHVRVIGVVENLTLTGSAILGIGNAADNVLKGNGADNQLRGMDGDDHLHGFGGFDTLIGGNGNDMFVFDSTPNSLTNRDFIADFSNVAGNNDTFVLENTFFTKLDAGALSAANFALGAAADANDYIVYNQTTGALFYDVNGSGGGGAIHFATLNNKAAITFSDFAVI